MVAKLPSQARTFIDPNTNRIDPLWYLFFRLLKGIAGNTHTVTSAEDTANTVTIDTGIIIASAIVQVIRSGKVVSSDPAVSFSSNNLTVANGSTYVLTAGDVLHWQVTGT